MFPHMFIQLIQHLFWKQNLFPCYITLTLLLAMNRSYMAENLFLYYLFCFMFSMFILTPIPHCIKVDSKLFWQIVINENLLEFWLQLHWVYESIWEYLCIIFNCLGLLYLRAFCNFQCMGLTHILLNTSQVFLSFW